MIVCACIFTFFSFIFQESLAEARVGSGLLHCQGHWVQQCMHRTCWRRCHYLHYLHHSLASGQTTGREHSPQQRIGLKIYWAWPSVQFSSVAQSCPTLCNPMNRSTPGLPVHHQLPEFTQTHVHRVGDAIQPSHPLSSPSPPAPNPSQHQGLFQWVNSSHEVAKVLEFQL